MFINTLLKMNSQELKKFVLENPKLVSMKPSVSYPGLFSLKYKKSVFFNDLWNRYTEECRGTIVTEDFDLVTYPFQKIYNYGIEARAPRLALDTPVKAFRKINGFMLAATRYQDNVLLSTTGSTDSSYVNMGRELIDPEKFRNVINRESVARTYLFEIVHPLDPHIIKETPGAYYLGFRDNAWGSKISTANLKELADQFGVYAPEEVETTLSDLQDEVKKCQHEGYVFYTATGIGAKIKSPYYLTLKWMARNPRTDKLLTEEFRRKIDEEYYGLLDHIRANIGEYTDLSEQERLEFARKYFLNKD